MKQQRPTLTSPFGNWNEMKLESESFDIVKALLASKYFTGIATKVADLADKQDTYRLALSDASSRDKNAIKVKNTAKTKLIDALVSMSNSVTEIADGNIEILTESNMPVRKQRQPRQPNTPAGLKLTTGDATGVLNCKWKDVKGKRLYIVAFTSNPLGEKTEWTMLNSAQSSYSIRELESGSKVWVKIGVIGSDNVTLWGDAILSPYIP